MTNRYPRMTGKTVQKWLILLLMLGLNSSVPIFAEKETPVYPEIKTASIVSRVFQNVTGFTPVSSWVGNRILHREISRHIQGDFHSRLQVFSGSDLLNRKAKKLLIDGQHVVLEQTLPLSTFRIETSDEMPLLVSSGHRPILLRPVQFDIQATLSEADINQLLQSERGKQILTGLKLSIPPFGPQTLDFINPSVTMEQNKVLLQTLMNTHGAPLENALSVQVSGRPSSEQSSLTLSDVNLKIQGFQDSDTDAIAQLIENYFGEIVDLRHLIKINRHQLKFNIKQSQITDHQFLFQASILVSPKAKSLKEALRER